MEDEGFDAPAMAEEQVDAVQEDVQSALAEIEDGEGAADEAETLRERWTRDERGRFTPHQAREGGGEQRGEDEVQPARAPDYWKAEFGDFGRLPPQVQNAILTREAQIHRFASDAGRRLKVWEPVEQALAEAGAVPRRVTGLVGHCPGKLGKAPFPCNACLWRLRNGQERGGL